MSQKNPLLELFVSPFADVPSLFPIAIASLSTELASCFEVAFDMAWTAVLDGCLTALASWYPVADVPVLSGLHCAAAVNAWQWQP